MEESKKVWVDVGYRMDSWLCRLERHQGPIHAKKRDENVPQA
jgi:hypothetical protein